MRRGVIAALSLLLILAVALALRLIGINWGLPNDWHFFSYHPDEATIALCTLLLDIFSLRMNPHHFNYGSLFTYLVYFAVLFAIGIGLLMPQRVLTLSYWRSIHATGRLLNALIGTLTVAIVWQWARMAYGSISAIFSALLIALVPIHVQHSHFMTVDVSLAFWSMVSLLYALQALLAIKQSQREVFKMLLLSGFFGGLAVGTKYGVLLPLCVTWLVAAYHIVKSSPFQVESELASSAWIKVQRVSKLIGLAVAMCIVGFLIACPYSVLAWREFVAGVSFEARHMRMGHGELFLNTGNGHIYHLRVNLNSGMGLPLMVASIFGVLWACLRRRPQDLLLLSFTLTYFFIVGCFKVRFARYLIPIVPPLCILAGNALCEVFQICVRPSKNILLRAAKASIATALWLIIVAYTGLYSIAVVKSMVLPDARDEAAKWVRANIPFGSTIAIAGNPWFYTVPVKPLIAGPYARYFAKCQFPNSEEAKRVNYKLHPTWFDLSSIKRLNASAFIATSFEYREFVRLRDKKVLRTLNELERLCKLGLVTERRFERPFELFGVKFGPSYIPHDMMYTNPTVRVFVFHKPATN
ncbi:MAG: hypothetical protein GDYSWBUE_001541 [Candidatus Fervidibacterota bacterium]